MIKLIKTSFAICLMLAMSISSAAEPDQVEAKAKSPNEVVWIDVRSHAENQQDSIPGDPHIPYKQILAGVTEQFPDQNTPIRLYCAKGGRAGKALNDLKAAGYQDVENVGGIDDVRKHRLTAADSALEPSPVN